MAGTFGGAYYAPHFFHLLPFIEQGNVWRAASVGGYIVPLWGLAGATPGTFLRQTRIPAYQCPSDATLNLNPATDWLPGDMSYAASFQSFGKRANSTSSNPVDWDGQSRIPATFQDGQSNTVIYAEKLAVCAGTLTNAGATFHPDQRVEQRRRVVVDARHLRRERLHRRRRRARNDSYPGDRVSAVFGGGKGTDGTIWYTGAASMFQSSPQAPQTTASKCDRGAPSGMHTGGINVAMGDGSRPLRPQLDRPARLVVQRHPVRRRSRQPRLTRGRRDRPSPPRPDSPGRGHPPRPATLFLLARGPDPAPFYSLFILFGGLSHGPLETRPPRRLHAH